MISSDSRPSTTSKASFRKNRKKMVKKHKIEGHTSDLAIKFAAALKKKMEKMTGLELRGGSSKRRRENKSIEIEGHTSNLAIKFANALRRKMEKMTGETFDGKRLKRKTETNLKSKASIKVQPRVTKAAT